MIETNYDAGQALTTWREVERTALKQGQIRLPLALAANKASQPSSWVTP